MTDHLTSYMRKEVKKAIKAKARETAAKKKKPVRPVRNYRWRKLHNQQTEALKLGTALITLVNHLVEAGKIDLKNWPKMPKKRIIRHTSRSD